MKQHIYNLRDSILSSNFIWTIIFFLSLISMVAVYSTSVSLTKFNADNTGYFLLRHVSFLVLGIFLIYLFSHIDYRKFNRWAPILLVAAIGLQILTFFIGVKINDATRWLQIPIINLTFQVSDFAKLALILYLARSISEKQDVIKGFRTAFIPIMLPILIVCGLIAPSNLSTAAVLFMGSIIMMFVGRIDIKYVGMIILLGVLLFSAMIVTEQFFPELTRADTWIVRITSFFNGTEDSYQLEQAKMAISNGHPFLPNPGNSQLKNFIPYSYADFIYPIICEEWGLFFGGFGVIVLYMCLLLHCVGIVSNSSRAFGALLTMGIGVNMVIQAFANIAVSLGLVPITGLPLPFISMGGTSLIFTSISFGMIISVSRFNHKLNLDPEEKDMLKNQEYDNGNYNLNESYN